ncbi:MAG: selenocysteine lyase/cysteine desulfurase [Gammaproteobacteria bacterium]
MFDVHLLIPVRNAVRANFTGPFLVIFIFSMPTRQGKLSFHLATAILTNSARLALSWACASKPWGSLMILPCQRHLFDIPDDIAYFNCAYMSPLMHQVVGAGQSAVARKAQPWRITPEDFFTDSDYARGLFARLVGSEADNIAIIPSVSYGIATAAANVGIKAGQSILTLADQFPSNVYVWRELARARGAQVRTVREGNAPLSDNVLEQIDQNTAIVTLAHCRWTDGALLDLAAISKRCREVGAALVLDITQSIGALPIDIAQVDADFLVAGCYKWMMGPYSLGFMHVAPRWHQGQALEQTWLGRAGSEDFARLVDYQDDYQPGAQRFDMGERSNFHLMPMAIAAITQLLEWGVDNIAETLHATTRDIAARAMPLGLTCPAEGERPGHYLGLRFAEGVPDGLLPRLTAEQVFVSVRGQSVRVTPHVYNNTADVDRLICALEKAATRALS